MKLILQGSDKQGYSTLKGNVYLTAAEKKARREEPALEKSA